MTDEKPSAPTIPDGPDGQVVRDAFKSFRLDPHNPKHWYYLLKAYAESGRKPPGRAQEWTDTNLVQLAADFARVQIDHPDKSERDICDMLAKLKRDGTLVYGGRKGTTLLRRLYDARNPERNSFLKSMLDVLMSEYEVVGGNTRERLLAWLTTGYTEVWEDKTGKLHFSPPEPLPTDAPAELRDRTIRLVRK
jgi:hypothetical protein